MHAHVHGVVQFTMNDTAPDIIFKIGAPVVINGYTEETRRAGAGAHAGCCRRRQGGGDRPQTDGLPSDLGAAARDGAKPLRCARAGARAAPRRNTGVWTYSTPFPPPWTACGEGSSDTLYTGGLSALFRQGPYNSWRRPQSVRACALCT